MNICMSHISNKSHLQDVFVTNTVYMAQLEFSEKFQLPISSALVGIFSWNLVGSFPTEPLTTVLKIILIRLFKRKIWPIESVQLSCCCWCCWCCCWVKASELTVHPGWKFQTRIWFVSKLGCSFCRKKNYSSAMLGLAHIETNVSDSQNGSLQGILHVK